MVSSPTLKLHHGLLMFYLNTEGTGQHRLHMSSCAKFEMVVTCCSVIFKKHTR